MMEQKKANGIIISGIVKILYEFLGWYFIMAKLGNFLEETNLVIAIICNDKSIRIYCIQKSMAGCLCNVEFL